MDSNFTQKDASVVNSEGSAPSEVHDVSRLSDGVSDLLGPVVVGGRKEADCFWGEGTIQAGQKDPEPEAIVFDEDGKYSWSPRKRPW